MDAELKPCCFRASYLAAYKFCPICGEPLPDNPHIRLYRVSKFAADHLIDVSVYAGTLSALLEHCRFSSYRYAIEVIRSEDLYTLLPAATFTDESAKFDFRGVTKLDPRQVQMYLNTELPGYSVAALGRSTYIIRRDFCAT